MALPKWSEPNFKLPPGLESKAETLTVGKVMLWVSSEEIPGLGERWFFTAYFEELCIGNGDSYLSAEAAKREAVRVARLWSIKTMNELQEAHAQLNTMLENNKAA